MRTLRIVRLDPVPTRTRLVDEANRRVPNLANLTLTGSDSWTAKLTYQDGAEEVVLLDFGRGGPGRMVRSGRPR